MRFVAWLGFAAILATQQNGKPHRIVSLSLGTDEILCALVDPQRIAALSRHALEPELSNIAGIARTVGVTVDRDVEQIVRLRPDLVLAARYSNAEMTQILRDSGTPLATVSDFRSFLDVEANIRIIGRTVGEPDRANRLIAEMRDKLASVRPPAKVWRVLYYTPSGWTAGPGTTIHEIISRAGYHNAAADVGFSGHAAIPVERVLELNPDVLLIGTGYSRDEGFRERLLQNPQLSTVRAIKAKHIVVLPSRDLLTVSHHLADSVLAFKKAMEKQGL